MKEKSLKKFIGFKRVDLRGSALPRGLRLRVAVCHSDLMHESFLQLYWGITDKQKLHTFIHALIYVYIVK